MYPQEGCEVSGSDVHYCIHSHILKVPFEGSEGSGIVYIWIGSETTQEEAIHAEQMGRSMFEVGQQQSGCLSLANISYPNP